MPQKKSEDSLRPLSFKSAVRDGVIAALLVLMISAITGYVVYYTASQGLKKEVQASLLGIAKSASELIDGDKHQQITQPDQKYSPLY